MEELLPLFCQPPVAAGGAGATLGVRYIVSNVALREMLLTPTSAWVS